MQRLWNHKGQQRLWKEPNSGTCKDSTGTACIDGCIKVHGGCENVSLHKSKMVKNVHWKLYISRILYHNKHDKEEKKKGHIGKHFTHHIFSHFKMVSYAQT